MTFRLALAAGVAGCAVVFAAAYVVSYALAKAAQ